LFAQYQFARSSRRNVALVQSITPVVKNSATYAELSREPDDVVASTHSFDSLPPKLAAIPLSFPSFHFAAPFPQSVHEETASLQRFIPNRDKRTDAQEESPSGYFRLGRLGTYQSRWAGIGFTDTHPSTPHMRLALRG